MSVVTRAHASKVTAYLPSQRIIFLFCVLSSLHERLEPHALGCLLPRALVAHLPSQRIIIFIFFCMSCLQCMNDLNPMLWVACLHGPWSHTCPRSALFFFFCALSETLACLPRAMVTHLPSQHMIFFSLLFVSCLQCMNDLNPTIWVACLPRAMVAKLPSQRIIFFFCVLSSFHERLEPHALGCFFFFFWFRSMLLRQ